jgi:hypothetical protein
LLKVKVKSLAAEARIIKLAERRSWGRIRDELRRHRALDVRDEARHTHIAYGFIRGRTLEQIEPGCQRAPDWKRVRAMTKKYGPANFVEPEAMKKAA